jgi:hypothetical protein
MLTRQRLKKPIRSSGKRGKAMAKASSSPSLPNPAPNTETKPKPDPLTSSLAETSTSSDPEPPTALAERVLRAVHWQLSNHEGFVPAFMSCLRYGPMLQQHAAWAKLADRAPGTTAIILAEEDEIIDPAEYAADALPLVGGKEHVRWRMVPGGHDFPMTFPRETLGEMYKAWGWE